MPSAAVKAREEAPYDPKRIILDKLGDLTGVEIAQNEVLIAIYFRPEMTTGGIVLPHSNLKEDQYQGKVGLVVKIGSACRFVRLGTDGVEYGIPIVLHDWVVVRPSDSWPMEINGHPDVLSRDDFVWCRLVHDDRIRMKVPHPGMVW